MYTGPHIIKDGLVFGYDTGYGITDNDTATRFYAGEPAVNLWDSLLSTQSLRPHTKHYWNGKKWTEDATYTHPGVDGPKDVYLGLVFKHVSGALNSTWSGTSYGYMLRDIACTNGATMTMSSWIYASGDCDVDAIPAVIEGESGGESTVTGYPSSYDLNNKGTWQVTAKKATSDGNTRFIPLYPRKNGVTDGSFTGFFMWALPQVTYGDRVVTPIQPGATRSSTASLIDLKETTDIDVSNVSFDSTGQPTFDGAGDRISMNAQNIVGANTGTVSAWVNLSQANVNHAGIFCCQTGPAWANMRVVLNVSSPNRIRLAISDGTNSTTDSCRTNSTLSYNTWYHIAATYDGTSAKIYVNGVLDETHNTTITPGTFTPNATMVGYQNYSTRYFNGGIAAVSTYDIAMTATEVKQNFNAHKNRFSI